MHKFHWAILEFCISVSNGSPSTYLDVIASGSKDRSALASRRHETTFCRRISSTPVLLKWTKKGSVQLQQSRNRDGHGTMRRERRSVENLNEVAPVASPQRQRQRQPGIRRRSEGCIEIGRPTALHSSPLPINPSRLQLPTQNHVSFWSCLWFFFLCLFYCGALYFVSLNWFFVCIYEWLCTYVSI